MLKSHRNLIVDLNNLTFVTRFSKLSTPKSHQRKEDHAMEYIFKEVVSYIGYFAHTNKCNAILIAVDSPHVWRKDFYSDYKDSSHEDPYHEDCIEAAKLAARFFMECTNASVVKAERAEADDIIGIFCNESKTENIILSSDKDFIQLLSDRVRLYSPSQKVFRESDDPEFDLFLKCIRGDRNDNIDSAFPRVRESKLREAWGDPMELLNLLETIRPDGKKVYDCFEENRRLIDLTEQPEYIKDNIREAIDSEIKRSQEEKSFSELKIMKFFGDLGMKTSADTFEHRYRALKGFVKK